MAAKSQGADHDVPSWFVQPSQIAQLYKDTWRGSFGCGSVAYQHEIWNDSPVETGDTQGTKKEKTSLGHWYGDMDIYIDI